MTVESCKCNVTLREWAMTAIPTRPAKFNEEVQIRRQMDCNVGDDDDDDDDNNIFFYYVQRRERRDVDVVVQVGSRRHDDNNDRGRL